MRQQHRPPFQASRQRSWHGAPGEFSVTGASWNNSSLASSDSDETPSLAANAFHVRRASKARQYGQNAWRISDRDSHGRCMFEKGSHADQGHNQLHATRHGPYVIRRSIIDVEGCSHAPHAAAERFPSNIADETARGVALRKHPVKFNKSASTKREEKDTGRSRDTFCHRKCSSRQINETHRSLSPAIEHNLGMPPSTSTKTRPAFSTSARSATHDTTNRKTKCSMPVVGDKWPSRVFHGHFRVILQDGSPFYSFSLQGSEEMLFARACKPEGACYGSNCDPDFLYAFHSKREDKVGTKWNCWQPAKHRLVSSPVAKMKVSAQCKYGDGNRYIEETCFVLYAERDPYSEIGDVVHRDGPLTRSCKDRSRGRSLAENSMTRDEKEYFEFLAVVMTVSTKSKHRVSGNQSYGVSSNILRIGVPGTCVAESSAISRGEETLSNFPKHIYRFLAPAQSAENLHSLQLGERSETICLNCLEECTDSGNVIRPHHAVRPWLLSEKLNCDDSEDEYPGSAKREVDVVILLPAGCHSWASDEDGSRSGPTPLLEYWQSDGACDCGGWDVGCGLLVLRAETLRLQERSAVALTDHDRINRILPGGPLAIVSQGRRSRKLLRMETIEPGIFSVVFREQFLPLQAFATAIAIFHQQTALR